MEGGNGIPSEADLPPKSKILAQVIPWDGYQRADLLTPAQFTLLQKFDKRPTGEQKEIITQNGHELAELFISVLEKINNPGTLQYVMSMLDDVLLLVPNFVYDLLRTGPSGKHKHEQHLPYQPFLKLLSHKEHEFAYIKLHSAKVLCRFFRSHDNHAKPEEVTYVVNWIMELLRERAPLEVRVGLSALGELLRTQERRLQFHQDNGLPLLCQLLDRYSDSFQLQYETLVCVWLLTYNPEVAETVGESGVIRRIVLALKNSSKEKIIRTSLATLANLIDKSDNTETMVDNGIVRLLQTLNNKKWGDEDIVNDLEKITESVSKTMNTMSSWQRYTKELQSRSLEWSPVHKSEQFWRENNEKFEDQNQACLKILAECLESPTAQVRAVAAFDLGEFARFHRNGKGILQRLGIKVEIMKLMSDPDAQVRKEALFAIQKTVPSMNLQGIFV